MAKTTVNEVDGFYIMSHKDKVSLDDLSKKTKIKKELIRKYIDDNTDTKSVVEIKRTGDKGYELVGKNNGAVVMTRAASELAETVRKTVVTPGHLCKIRQND